MISKEGIIDVAEFCQSPNFDERPNNAAIDLIVIHAISLPAGLYNTQLIKDLFFTSNVESTHKWCRYKMHFNNRDEQKMANTKLIKTILKNQIINEKG